MEYNVPNTIVPQGVVDEYLNTYSNDPSFIEEIFAISERIKGATGCDQPLPNSKAVVHVVVGPQGAGKSSVIGRMAKQYDHPVIIDRYDFMQQLPSFKQASMLAQESYDGNIETLRKDLEATTQRFLPAALWIENDVMSCAVSNNKTVFVETSGTNTLKFIDRLENAIAHVSVHACIAPLQVVQDAAAIRYSNSHGFAISEKQIEQEHNRLIDILPQLIDRVDDFEILVRGKHDQPLQSAVKVTGNSFNRNDYLSGMLDAILSPTRKTIDEMMGNRFRLPAGLTVKQVALEMS